MADSEGTAPVERDFYQLSLGHQPNERRDGAGHGTSDEAASPRRDPSGSRGAPLTASPGAVVDSDGALEGRAGVDQTSAVSTEEAVGKLSSRSPVNGTTSDDGGKGGSTDGSTVSTLSSLGSSSTSSLSLTPARGPPSTSEAATRSPPPLHPRASAPATAGPTSPPPPGGGSRRAMPPGGGGVPGRQGGPLRMPPSLAAKMAAMTSRSSTPSSSPSGTPSPTSASQYPLRTPSGATPSPALAPRPPPRPPTTHAPSAPAGRIGAAGPLAGGGMKPMGGMAARRKGPGAGLTLSQMGISTGGEGASPGGEARGGVATRLPPGATEDAAGQRKPGSPTHGRSGAGAGETIGGTPFSNFGKIVDPSGRLNFASKAILHADGVDFSSGASFKVKMDDFELFEELGKGNYGTVQKVVHKPTGVTMALKEIRLELDDSKLKTIITELDILHRATSPYIIDFYGAFFIESCVYYCMEFMDAGSLDYLAGTEIPEDVLAKVTRCMVEGLKFLKDELKIMHRDVKPTNVLLNMKGYVKLCDFGVSGQLDRSLAKTNIGCQSYMAPERIKGESQGATTSYTASSDVWSLGLSIIEAAIGHYPYPPETYSNVFAQLTAIVHGDPPTLPYQYSDLAKDFVAQCLRKQAHTRPKYKQLLAHPWLESVKDEDVDVAGWVARAHEYRKTHPKIQAPALA
ncbi:mitogen-activated protein kinase kinase [Rhodotorula toruloides]|uniref:mitogen-activated protein kinase kinase n=1 Tax=Rhodotorula toruloides TaxID=5286 RepID=A0A511KI36_RHOTO|nr:mitogen-activated protein kinase kinase [Rhodotorula toruloides]